MLVRKLNVRVYRHSGSSHLDDFLQQRISTACRCNSQKLQAAQRPSSNFPEPIESLNRSASSYVTCVVDVQMSWNVATPSGNNISVLESSTVVYAQALFKGLKYVPRPCVPTVYSMSHLASCDLLLTA